MVTVADCERVQASWFRARAEVLGGEVWSDGPLEWVDGPDGQTLMFPRSLPADAVARGVERAKRRGAGSVGVWLSADVDAGPLAEAGFERGWSPWWMTAPIAELEGGVDPRIELQLDSDDYGGQFADYRAQLALARLPVPRAWYAAAYDGGSRRFAGRAWSFLDGESAGVFDMAVWEPFRRRGLGSGLLRVVCAAAGRAGARHAVLNATPEGKLLYSKCGFTQIGAGITWWLHLP
ncbi:GNAT family N-acetyltransferase [Streptomyces sp. NPDC091280]|uniref:GNAT family N-acetyltransferase n=1 Tax=Streptomyces sp. NPDC091280 TaxID=3365984 RepID=UPI0037FDE2A7